jgi:ribosomal protein S18 acetylase RimI-like enzyme
MVNGDAEYPIHACLNKKVIGTLWVTMGAFTEKGVIDKESIYVHSFGIDEKYRHKGIGRKMLRFVKDYYKTKNIYLGVVKKNINAFNFYKKEGFNVVEDCSSFYRMVNRKSI